MICKSSQNINADVIQGAWSPDGVIVLVKVLFIKKVYYFDAADEGHNAN